MSLWPATRHCPLASVLDEVKPAAALLLLDHIRGLEAEVANGHAMAARAQRERKEEQQLCALTVEGLRAELRQARAERDRALADGDSKRREGHPLPVPDKSGRSAPPPVR